MFVQRLYGLHVRCKLPIPFAPPAIDASPSDVSVIPAPPPHELANRDFTAWERSSDARHHRVARAGDVWRLLYDDGTSIHVAPDAVYLSWPPDQTFADACTYLVGAPFAILLRSRGFACVHGSAVAWRGRTLAFVGPSGAGKSTLAASLIEQGATLVTDDLLAISLRDGRPFVQPSYAGVRLWPRSVELLRDDRNALPPITPNWDKRVLEAEIVSGPVALDEIHVLADTEGAGAADTLMQLVANAYRPDLATPEWQRNEFLTLAETVKATRCSVLKPHEDWRKLPRMLEHGNV